MSSSGSGFGVVSNFSPMNSELAPATKHSATASRESALRPALSRTIEAGIRIRAVAIVRTKTSGSSASRCSSGVPATRTSALIGNAFRMRIERGKLMQQADAIALRFAEADDSAAANGDSRFSHRRERAEAVIVIAGGDDLPVEFRRSIEVVVVRSQPRGGQAPRLRIVEHAERAANFHSQLGHAAHHFQNVFKILALLHVPPRGAHAETRRSLAAGALGKFHDFVHGKQAAARNFRRVMRALRAIGAIFRAPAGFHGKQAAKLDARGIVEFAVRLLGRKEKIRQRLPVDAANFFARPIVAQSRPGCRNACIVLRQGCSSTTIFVVRHSARHAPRNLLVRVRPAVNGPPGKTF